MEYAALAVSMHLASLGHHQSQKVLNRLSVAVNPPKSSSTGCQWLWTMASSARGNKHPQSTGSRAAFSSKTADLWTPSGSEEREVLGIGLGSRGWGGVCTEEGAQPQHRHDSRSAKGQWPNLPHTVCICTLVLGKKTTTPWILLVMDLLWLSGRAVLNAKF